MLDTMTTSEAVAVLCLRMVGADESIKPEELTTMLSNPFFLEHVSEKIGPHGKFLRKYNQARKHLGGAGIEKKAIASLKSGFPALQIKTLALMTLIAGADGEYDQTEKELVARVATEFKIPVEDIEPELGKMQEAFRQHIEKVKAEQEKIEAEKQEKGKPTPEISQEV